MGSFFSAPAAKEHSRKPAACAQQYEVAIVGAGIGGLALAIALEHASIPYTVYESAREYAIVGAGVGIGPNAMRAMDMIDTRFRGKYNEVCVGNLTPGKEHVMMEAAMIEEGLGERTGWAPTPWGSPRYRRTAAHRKDLLDIMTSFIPLEKVKFQKRLVEIQEASDEVTLQFEDGTKAVASLVVGGDGIKGFTRGYVLASRHPDEVQPKYSHQYAYRAVVPLEDAREILGNLVDDSKIYFGRNVYLSTYVISRGQEINVVGFVGDADTWDDASKVTREVSRDRMVADFTSHNADKRLLKLLEWGKPVQWAMFHHPRTSTYHSGLVCLLGDAAHASLPNQAAGAGQGLEDALILAHAIGVSSEDLRAQYSPGQKVRAAFATYDSIRRPRAQRQVDSSVECGKLYNLSHDGIGEDMVKTVENLNHRFDWLWDHDLAGDVALVQKLYEEALVPSK